jgi:hypothetical protein
MKQTKLYQKVLKVLMTPKPTPVEDIHRSLDIVEYVLRDARDLKVETEVVTWALKRMKENPKLDISDAIQLGYEEWVR